MSDLPQFDELVKLAQENPEAFEELRQQQISNFIDNANESSKARLRGLQFQIDAQRTIHSHSPMGSCIKISQMMNETFADLRSWLNQVSGLSDPLRGLADESQKTQPTETKQADILAFPSS